MTNVIIRHAHDHDANAAVIEIQVIKNTIKRRAAAPQETTSQVLTAVTRTISRAGQGQLPHIGAQRKLVQRIRTANIAASPTPRDTNTLIPQQFTERIQCEIGMEHPTLWKFIDALRKVHKGWESFHESLIRGDDPPTKLRKDRRADERIQTLVRDYANRTIDDYLRGIAHNYEMIP